MKVDCSRIAEFGDILQTDKGVARLQLSCYDDLLLRSNKVQAAYY